MPTPTFWSGTTVSTSSGNDVTDALLTAQQWVKTNLTFSFAHEKSDWSDSATTGYGPASGTGEPWAGGYAQLKSFQKEAIRDVYKMWSNVSGLKFTETNDGPNSVGDMRFAFVNGSETGHSTAQAWVADFPERSSSAGDVWFNAEGSSAEGDWDRGSENYMVAMHEIGHALGLKHTHDNGDGTFPLMPSLLDSRMYTVMSYCAAPGRSDSVFSFEPTTPMVIDIAAIQHKYGANMSYRTGNDTYTFKEGSSYNQTIWDAGGNDTIAYASDDGGHIDLRSGYNFGNRLGKEVNITDLPTGNIIYHAVDNVWIAFGAVIENGFGGGGNDVVYGNAITNRLLGNAGNDVMAGNGGNDLIDGGTGADRLTGGEGADRFVFSVGGNTYDTIVDFSHSAGDTIQFQNSAFTSLRTAGVLSAANFRANTTGLAGDANDYIIYETDTGKLYYDANGSAAGQHYLIAILGAHPTLVASDIIVI